VRNIGMKKALGFLFKCAPIIFLVAFYSSSHAQEAFPVSELRFQGFFAQRDGDKTTYCLLGNGFLRTITSNEEDSTISEWLRMHPKAQAVPVSIINEGSKMPIVYVWAVDGPENLNLLLVREGVLPGIVMLDPVLFDQATKGTRDRADIEAGYDHAKKTNRNPSATKDMPPRRLISGADYDAFLKALRAAQDTAQKQKLGIWSDRFKDLRGE